MAFTDPFAVGDAVMQGTLVNEKPEEASAETETFTDPMFVGDEKELEEAGVMTTSQRRQQHCARVQAYLLKSIMFLMYLYLLCHFNFCMRNKS